MALAWIAAGPITGAAAQPARAPVHLRWARPAGSTCIAAPALEHKVEALLERTVFVADERAAVRIAGRVEAHGNGWIATLQVVGRQDASGPRLRQLEHEGSDCAALNPALTVVLATLIDLEQSAVRSDEGLPLVLGVAGAVGWGVLPKPSAGGSLLLGVRPSTDWSAWLDASVWLPVDQLDSAGRGGELSAWQAGLALCRELPAGERITLAGCAGAQLGAIDGEGRGLGPNRSSLRLLAQTNLEGALSIRLFSVVALRAGATGVLALSRPRFYVVQPDDTRSDVFRPSLFGVVLRAGIAVELR